jgi:hypothetical protein
MANTYYDETTKTVTNGTRADAADINNVNNGVEAGFDMLPEPDPLKEGRHLVSTQAGTANAIRLLQRIVAPQQLLWIQ